MRFFSSHFSQRISFRPILCNENLFVLSISGISATFAASKDGFYGLDKRFII